MIVINGPQGRHRRSTPHRHAQWMRAGVFAAGLGAAVLTSQATASAETGDGSGDNSGKTASATTGHKPTHDSPAGKPRVSKTTARGAASPDSDRKRAPANPTERTTSASEAKPGADVTARVSSESTNAALRQLDPVDTTARTSTVSIRSAKAERTKFKPAPAAAATVATTPTESASTQTVPLVPPAGPVAKTTAPVHPELASLSAADIDYGVGSGVKVGVLAGVLGSPRAVMKQLQGSVCAAPNSCEPIHYFNVGDFFGSFFGRLSLGSGVKKLDQWLVKTPGEKIVLGHSFGALVIYRWLRLNSSNPDAPSPDELSFITLAAAERSGTGYANYDPKGMFQYRVADGLGIPMDTPYHVLDVCRKWDGWCYWIPEEAALSKKGMAKLHMDYKAVNVNDPANEVRVDGNVIYVLVPTPGYEPE